jgi:glycosyltransferase involved in cell wall biosynthesis
MVAAYRDQKDHETLLKAMTLLPDNYRLQLVGNCVKEDELKALTIKMWLCNRVAFLGVRQDVPDVLEGSDVIILSSHWEGLSLSSIEGMASGRPFVASDVEGLRDIVSGAGVLFPHGDETALAKEIQKLCEHPDLYRKTAMACQVRAKEFDISLMADRYYELYKSLNRQQG